jgi:hypothetical protein
MKNPIFSLEEVTLLLFKCEGKELLYLRSVVTDDYNLGRYNSTDYANIFTLIDRKLHTGKLIL